MGTCNGVKVNEQRKDQDEKGRWRLRLESGVAARTRGGTAVRATKYEDATA